MVDNMEIDSPAESQPLMPRDRITKRLAQFGVPEEQLDQPGLVSFFKDKKASIPDLVSIILPKDEEIAEVLHDARLGSRRSPVGVTMKNRFRESMAWLQWLMFEGDPNAALRTLSRMSAGQRGICGAVWGSNDIVYRCRTCEQDPSCVLCVPCFENGNHKSHDYVVMYSVGGGCCDCGDVTAWKHEAFCSEHKGVEQIQPLPESVVNSVAPVLSSLFNCWEDKLTLAETWEDKLTLAETISQGNSRASDTASERKKIANEITFAVVDMLLEFCKHSESFLSFVARLLLSYDGLLGILVRAERFLVDGVVEKLHELLLKLLGDPTFKYEFAKVLFTYYPSVINETIKECSDHPMKRYPLLSTFSVQILTVPTLAPRLVKEINLLAMLLGCLEKIFISCAKEDDRLQVSKWAKLFETTIRVGNDIQFVMSHVVVPKYVTCNQQDISRTLMRLMSFVQGMNPQKRETDHMEEESENVYIPFVLCHLITKIHFLLVDGAFSDASKGELDNEIVSSSNKQGSDDVGNLYAKVGWLSQEGSAGNSTSRSSAFACSSKVSEMKSESSHLLIPHSITWLIYECLRAIEHWLGVDNTSGVVPNTLNSNSGSICHRNFSKFRKTLYNIRRGKHIFGRPACSSKGHNRQYSDICLDDLENGKYAMEDGELKKSDEFDSDNICNYSNCDDTTMETEFHTELDGLHFLSVSEWPQIVYDVSSQDISVHIPLHRLLSIMLQRALRRYYGESTVADMDDTCSANASSAIFTDFLGNALGGIHPYGFSAFIMEHPLRIRVFSAQVHAGMWRKNGDAALFSCEGYHTVRWSEQGELDLFLLQCCAALAPADPYVSRILERFGLSNYLSLNLERSSEYESVLVQEMLTLIIQIIKERRFCGLNTAESLKRELIFKLAIGDATHSQLVKSLPRDLSKFEQLQDILHTVAVYSNPSGFNEGIYSLRLPFWKELDLYHPRWNSKDLQTAEERYVRFCSVSALTTQVPHWTKIYPPLEGIARIATCKVVLQIIQAVLFYAVFTFKLAESRAPDGVLLTALHLLSLSLDICFQQKKSGKQTCYDGAQIPIIAFSGEIINVGSRYGGEQSLLSLLVLLMRMHQKEDLDNFVEAGSCSLSALIEGLLKKFAEIDDRCMTQLQQLAPEVVSHISEQILTIESVSVSASDSKKRKAKARERQAAIMEKMRAQQSKFLATNDCTVDGGSQVGQEGEFDTGHDADKHTQVVCSLCHDHDSKHPISFLTLLQRSRLVSFVDRGPPSWTQFYRPEKSIAENKMKDTSEMNWTPDSIGSTSSAQLAQLFQNAATELTSSGQPGEVDASVQHITDHFLALEDVQVPNASYDEGERTPYTFETLEQDMYFSICREMHDVMPCSNLMNESEKISTCGGNSSKIRDAGSVLLGKYLAGFLRGVEKSSACGSVRSENASVESTSQLSAYDGFGPADCDGIHLSSCGHAVHQGCLDRYLSSLKERSVRRMVFEGHIADPDQGEFLCPVCRRLVNGVLPTLPGDFPKFFKQPTSSSTTLTASNKEAYSLHLKQALMLMQYVANAVGKDEFLKAVPLCQRDGTRPNLEPLSRVLSKMYFPGKQDKLSRSSRLNNSMLMWDTLKYSLISVEIAARCGRTSLIPNYALTTMYEELKASSGFILSLLMKLVDNMRSKNSLHVLQRFRGLQVFAESFCSGVSLRRASNGVLQRGDLLSLSKIDDLEVLNTDIQFWIWASDPILAHDAFTTLMWVLFCLPCPFLSCEESLLSLMHAFYLVAVTQAIILYCGKCQLKLSESDLSDCLISDIYKVMAESGSAHQYFASNYFDPNVDIKDAIRRLSFPYLRRCELLWKILYSSSTTPFYDEGHVFNRSWNASDHAMNSSKSFMFELTKVYELENKFKIPSLDVILKDELSRSLVCVWLRHFYKEYESCNIHHKMHMTPAVPFELMRLPNVYQELLQRCIKQCCNECKALLDEPALCLLCGRLCSPSWKSCCRESGCLTHAMACGAGTGVFLLIKRTTILLQRSARQAPWPSPYLDSFGEEDFDMSRGRPLYLNEERYAALNYMVSSHGLDRNSKVLGQTTIGSFFLM